MSGEEVKLIHKWKKLEKNAAVKNRKNTYSRFQVISNLQLDILLIKKRR